MFTLTITPKVGPTRVESFDSAKAMSDQHGAYTRCGINATPAIDGVPCYAYMDNNGDRTYYVA